MLKVLGLGKAAPGIVASDEIIPLHWFEDGLMWKKVIVYTLFVFDDSLDPEKLRGALERLVQRETYKKLGSRLRTNVRISEPILHVLSINLNQQFLIVIKSRLKAESSITYPWSSTLHVLQ